MPLKRVYAEAKPVEPVDNGPFGGAGKWLATGARIGGGALSNAGGVPGAIAGGGSELLAEFLEGSLGKSTIARVGVEAGLGMIPLGKVLSTGRAIKSAGKFGLMSGAGDAGRQWAEGNFDEGGTGLDKTRLGLSTLAGAATGGVLGKFFNGVEPPAPAPKPIIETFGLPAGVKRQGPPARTGPGYEVGGEDIRGYEPRKWVDPATTSEPVGSLLEQTLQKSGSRAGYQLLVSKGVSPEAAMRQVSQATERIVQRRAQTAPQPFAPRTPYGSSIDDVAAKTPPDELGEKAQASFSTDLEKLLAGKLDKLPNKTAAFNRDAARVLDEASEGSAKTAKSWQDQDVAWDDEFQAASNARDLDIESQLQGQFERAMTAGDRREARRLLEARKKSLEKQQPTVSETVKAGNTSSTTRWKPAEQDDLGDAADGVPVSPTVPPSVDGIHNATSPAGPVGALKKALTPRLPKEVKRLITNLDDEAKSDFDQYLIQGEAPRSAYKKSYEVMQRRIAKARSNGTLLTEVPPTPSTPPAAPVAPVDEAPDLAALAGQYPIRGQQPRRPTNFDELRNLLGPTDARLGKNPLPAPRQPPDVQTTHPSFFDDGFDSLENANKSVNQTTHPSFYDDGFDNLEMARGKSTIPDGAAAKLASHTNGADPEVAKKLAEASAIYNDPNVSKEAKRAAGKQLGQLRDMLEGKGKFAPKGDSSAPPQGADWVAEQTAAADHLAKLKGDPSQRGASEVEALLAMALTGVGATAGAAMNDESPIEGALIGGSLGAGTALTPSLMRAIGRNVNDLNGDPNRVKEFAAEIVQKLPQFQRYSMLMGPNLPANAWIGPWGSVLTGAIEGLLKGDPRALPLLKESWNPVAFANNAFGRKSAWDEAYDAIKSGELGRDAVDDRTVQAAGDLSNLDKTMLSPGLFMTAGDRHARNILERNGYNIEESRAMTMTGEPQGNLPRQIANFGKGSWLGNLLMPFKRTPANILEQGSQRTPILGSIVHNAMGNDVPLKHQVIEQTAGGVVGLGAYGIAANNPDQQSRRRARAYVTNLAGRYGLPATIGYMLGDASAEGNDLSAALKDPFNWQQALPLPTVEPAVDIAKAALPADNKRGRDYIPESMQLKSLRNFLTDLGVPGIGTEKPRRTLRRVYREQ